MVSYLTEHNFISMDPDKQILQLGANQNSNKIPFQRKQQKQEHLQFKYYKEIPNKN